MLNFKTFAEEIGNSDVNIKKVVEKVFASVYNGGTVTNFTSSLKGSSVFTFYLLNKSEWVNNIPNNDPISLGISVENDKGVIVTEFTRNALMVNPTSSYMAYGKVKLNARKFSAKDMNEFETKLKKSLQNIFASVEKEINKGNMDVWGDETVDIIKKRIK